MPETYRKASVTPPRDRKFLEPDAPHFSRTRRRRAIVKRALETLLADEKTEARIKAGIRSFLKHVHELERRRPDSTACGLLAITSTETAVWVYEPGLAPAGHCPTIHVRSNAALNQALKELRSMH